MTEAERINAHLDRLFTALDARPAPLPGDSMAATIEYKALTEEILSYCREAWQEGLRFERRAR